MTKQIEVLVVGENEQIAGEVSEKLASVGIPCDLVYMGDEAGRLFAEKLHRLVIAHVDAEGAINPELLADFRARSPLVQLIVIARQPSFELLLDCVERGAVDLLVHDGDWNLLQEAVLAALDRMERWTQLIGRRPVAETVEAG